MIRPQLAVISALFLSYHATEGKFVLDRIGKPLTPEELRKGENGFDCLKELFGKEGEHILTDNPSRTAGFGFGIGYSPPMNIPTNNGGKKDDEEAKQQEDEEVVMTKEERYEAIFMVFGEDGIDNMCDITRKLRKARMLSSVDENREPKNEEPSSANAKNDDQRRTQACISAYPLYPALNDIDNAYNNWAEKNVDQFLPEGADRTSRTDPDKLITDIQDSIDVSMEGEYAAMACRPIFDGIQAIVTIPDAVVFQQGSIVGGLKQFFCGFGNSVAQYATGELYKQLNRARFHDYAIDGAESRASYVNMGNMVNQACESQGRLQSAADELAAIKRDLEKRRRRRL